MCPSSKDCCHILLSGALILSTQFFNNIDGISSGPAAADSGIFLICLAISSSVMEISSRGVPTIGAGFGGVELLFSGSVKTDSNCSRRISAFPYGSWIVSPSFSKGPIWVFILEFLLA